MTRLFSRLGFTAFFLIITAGQIFATSYPDIKIIEQTSHRLVIDWTPQNFHLHEIEINGKVFKRPVYDLAVSSGKPGAPDIPWRILTIGKPANSTVRVTILDSDNQSFPGINIAPVPIIGKDKKNVSEFIYRPEAISDRSDLSFPSQQIYHSDGGKFRDIAIEKIQITPFLYSVSSKTLVFNKRVRLLIEFNNIPPRPVRFRKRGKLDDLYQTLLLNFEQARNWQVRERVSLKKASLSGGDWYRIPVKKDGLYKITVSLLKKAGINTDHLGIDAIRLYNNGGHTLSYKVNKTLYNPPYTQEIPGFIHDANGNNVLDGNDYILFYGKSVNGWFYSDDAQKFTYQMHPYATSNYYLLNINPAGDAKQMTEDIPPMQSNPVSADFFYDRYHFEEDLYNLLASGPDWYGNRFFGLSDSYSKTFNITTNQAAGSTPKFVIRLKGGSGIKYGDNQDYRYYFKMTLNGKVLYDKVSFTEETRKTYSKNITDPTIVLDGDNKLDIQYSAYKYESSNAYLDWFELYFPRDFQAQNTQLLFYTKTYRQPVRYQVKGFDPGNEVYVFNVTDPTNPYILYKNLNVQNGSVTFDTPVFEHPQALLVTSLSSTQILTPPTPVHFSPGQDLLDANQQADLLIITHKTFVPYARQLAELRSELSSKIVTMDEIYFNFNSSVPDPTALRNFLRYVYSNWQEPKPSYVLLFGDGHYDYRNITIPDTMRVPPFEIYDAREVDSRTTDAYFVDLDYRGDASFPSLSPDLGIGRLPIESTLDAERIIEKLTTYEKNPQQQGWQTLITFVADDEKTTRSNGEWMHQNQAEALARMSQLRKFNKKKIYLSAYPSVPGGFSRIKPKANNDLIKIINQGTLIVNYLGHGSPTQWAHENVFNMNRDLNRLNNPGKLPFIIAATCDFGKFDDPHEPSFSEALIWREESGAIAVLSATRLVYSDENASFNTRFYGNLFPNGAPSIHLGDAWLASFYGNSFSNSSYSNVNDQKYHLFADPSMYLADPRGKIQITKIKPDILKALSKVEVEAEILDNGRRSSSFEGGAVLIVNDARYESVILGERFAPVTFDGPLIFKGEVSVEAGIIKGKFIVPKSIRYKNKPTGRITIFAWTSDNAFTALGYNSSLLFKGSNTINDSEGPEIDVYFQNQEQFTSGDIVEQNPVLIAELEDENGINMTDQTGHFISLQIDDKPPQNISGFFVYERNSFTKGSIRYPLDNVNEGEHRLLILAYDNVNNPTEQEIRFKVVKSGEIALTDVINYPNPFSTSTRFTFQTNRSGADVRVKIYTISGRLIEELRGISVSGYNDDIIWTGRDRDGDSVTNGVYLYKIIIDDGQEKKEHIDKLVIMR